LRPGSQLRRDGGRGRGESGVDEGEGGEVVWMK